MGSMGERTDSDETLSRCQCSDRYAAGVVPLRVGVVTGAGRLAPIHGQIELEPALLGVLCNEKDYHKQGLSSTNAFTERRIGRYDFAY